MGVVGFHSAVGHQRQVIGSPLCPTAAYASRAANAAAGRTPMRSRGRRDSSSGEHFVSDDRPCIWIEPLAEHTPLS